jgi:hypothetical protein
VRSNKFKLTVKGAEADESIRLGDLAEQLNALKQTLDQVDAALNGDKKSDLYYRITNITMNSPATFEVEAISRSGARTHGKRVVSRLNRDLSSVVAGKRPRNADIELIESYCSLLKPMQRHGMEVSLKFADNEILLPRKSDMNVDNILGADLAERGSVVGSLDALDIHERHNIFKIYPVVGPRVIRCHFRQDMLAQVVSGINRFVRIFGLLHYKKSEKFPHSINVDTIEVLPERSDACSLSNLRGIAPNAYDGLTSTEYVEKVRNDEW